LTGLGFELQTTRTVALELGMRPHHLANFFRQIWTKFG